MRLVQVRFGPASDVPKPKVQVMQRPDSSNKRYPKMTADKRRRFEKAIAEEKAAQTENVAAAKPVAEKLVLERKKTAALVAELRAAREAAGVSLSEIDQRTGIRKSALSRLENSKAPNPTLVTLQRYATAIGMKLEHLLKAI